MVALLPTDLHNTTSNTGTLLCFHPDDTFALRLAAHLHYQVPSPRLCWRALPSRKSRRAHVDFVWELLDIGMAAGSFAAAGVFSAALRSERSSSTPPPSSRLPCPHVAASILSARAASHHLPAPHRVHAACAQDPTIVMCMWPPGDRALLPTVGSGGMTVEIGPLAHSTVDANLLLKTMSLIAVSRQPP